MKIIMTGGHHNSAIPVIDLILNKYPDIYIYWFGHRKSLKGDKNDTLEFKEITNKGIPFFDLKAGKVYRTFDLSRLLKVPVGFFQALYLLLKIRPSLIVSFGGYLAVPVVLAGKLLGIPSITHEQTVVAGYANKVISKFADKVMLSWRQSESLFPKSKVMYTGIPIRESITKVQSDSFNSPNGLPYIYITAGKTGSVKINSAVNTALAELLRFCNVIHQCGDYSEYDSYNILAETYSKLHDKVEGKYFLRKFVLEHEIGEAFARASLVVSRAGAHIISELLFLEKPSLLIPIPWVSHDEQNKNAQYLVAQNLATLLDEKDLTAEALVDHVRKMLVNISMFRTISSANTPKILAEELIVNEILKYK